MNHLQNFLLDTNDRINNGYYHTDGPALSPNGGLRAAITGRPDAVIAEIKPRSPSQGRLLERPLNELIAHYRWGGAAGLSVLTDPDHFDGSIDNLRAAHASGLPLLFKDFVIDETQLDAAAHHGASAVLLIERVLAPERREQLVRAARERGLEVLLEVCDQAEAEQALASDADLIGVNARDLATLQVDLEGALKTVQHLAMQNKTVVSLSGVRHRQDRLNAVEAGAAAVLVGTSLVQSPDPGLHLRALRRPLAKVCGLTQQEDVAQAADAGADLAGFVVGADSPRANTPMAAQALVEVARRQGMRTVLVTPHADLYEVREWCRLVRPDYVQLHGQAPDADWLHSLKAIPSLALRATAPGAVDRQGYAGVLFDTPRADGSTGGAGATHDWNATAMAAAGLECLTLVAGGLNPNNVAQAIATTACWGADASSGLESEPGVKDPHLISAYVRRVHGDDA